MFTKHNTIESKNPLDRAKQGAMIMTNGTRPLNAVPSDCQVVPRSSSHFGDFNATSHHLATRSTHLGSFPVLTVSVTRIVHSFSHVKQLFGRVNAERRIIKRIGRSHQVQRDRCDDSSERNMGSQVELINFSLFPWVNLCSN